jgi:hypothetical protein
MEARSFPALPRSRILTKKPCANNFPLDCLLMEVAEANAGWRWLFRVRG